MTLVSQPNGILIAGTLFLMSAVAVLARAYFSAITPQSSEADRQQRKNELTVAGWFGLPMLGIGTFLHGAGQMITAPLGAGLACLLIGLALTLAVYAVTVDLLADRLNLRTSKSAEPVRKPLSAPPKLKAVEVHEVDRETMTEDVTRQAVPV
jgi:hypothetical protein